MAVDETSNICSFDLYSDIIEDNFQERESSYTELEEKFKGIQEEVCVLRQQLEEATRKVNLFQEENIILKKNISSLLKTAKCEIQRKSGEIKRLRSCVENRWRREQRNYLHRRSYHDLSNSLNEDACDSVTDGVPSSENIGFSKYSYGKKSSDHLNSTNHKTTVEHRESPKKGFSTTGRGDKSERNPDQQKSICPPKGGKNMVIQKKTYNKSDQRNFEIDSKRKSVEKNHSGCKHRRSDRSIDVSGGRLDGRRVKNRMRSSENKDKSDRKRESSKGRIPDKENVSSQASSHNSGSRKRRHQSDSSSSSKRTKTIKSPQRPPEGKTSSVRKYLQASPVLPTASEPSVDVCRQKTASAIEAEDTKTNGKDSRTVTEVEGKNNDRTRPGSLEFIITNADSKTADKVELAKKVLPESTVSVNASVVTVYTNNEVTQRDDRTLIGKNSRNHDTYKSKASVSDHYPGDKLETAASGSLTDKTCEFQEFGTPRVIGDKEIECQPFVSCLGDKVETSNPFHINSDLKTHIEASVLESNKSPLKADSATATKAEAKSSLKISLSSGSNASVSSSLCGGDTLRTLTNQTASNCSVLSANATSCSSSEVSLESCQRTTARRDSVCTVTSTTLWESNNGVTTWVQGVEYVNGVKKYRLRILKPGETFVSSSAESLQSSDTTSPSKGCASELTKDDFKSAILSGSNELMDEGSLTEIRQCSALKEQIDDCPAAISPFRTPADTPSLDKLPNADQVPSTDSSPVGKSVGSPKESSLSVKISCMTMSQCAVDSECTVIKSKHDESSPKSPCFINTSKTVGEEQKNEAGSARRSSTVGRDSKKPDCHQSPPSSPKKQKLTNSKRLSSQGRGDRKIRSRQSSTVENTSSERKDCRVADQPHMGLNETSESLMSIPEDVYVFIGEENDSLETNGSPGKSECISDGRADMCGKREAGKVSTSIPLAGTEEGGESLSDKEQRFSSTSFSHTVEKIESLNGSVVGNAKCSPFLSKNDVGHSDLGDLKGNEDYLSEESEIEDGELTSDSDYLIQQSPQIAAQKSPTLRSSSDQPIVDLRQKLLAGKRVDAKPSRESSCRVSSVGHFQSVRERQRSSECRHERSKSPSIHRIKCQSAKQPPRHGHQDLHNQSSSNRHRDWEEHVTSPDGNRHRGRIRNGPARLSFTESRHRSSSPKPSSVKDRDYQSGCSSNRSSRRVSEDRDRSCCQTRSRSNSSSRSTQSHRSDLSATETCHCCTRHQERTRSPQHCERRCTRHGGERYVSRSPSPRRTHRYRKDDMGHRLSPHRRYSSRPRHDHMDNPTHRSSARRPTSPPHTVHSSGRSKVSPYHTRGKDSEKVTSHRTTGERDKTSRNCSGSERYPTRGAAEDKERRRPPVESRERDRNARVKFDSLRSDKTLK
ncbi:uncharacterized protein LOC135480218 [Liolophura sinensis]|uniref:uncharacterized protein LOC135480218 n=1 Tax=Liolophura sinensis TaxID=3198878 RepID=UPI003158FB56